MTQTRECCNANGRTGETLYTNLAKLSFHRHQYLASYNSCTAYSTSPSILLTVLHISPAIQSWGGFAPSLQTMYKRIQRGYSGEASVRHIQRRAPLRAMRETHISSSDFVHRLRVAARRNTRPARPTAAAAATNRECCEHQVEALLTHCPAQSLMTASPSSTSATCIRNASSSEAASDAGALGVAGSISDTDTFPRAADTFGFRAIMTSISCAW
jgi:hypothetical protein